MTIRIREETYNTHCPELPPEVLLPMMGQFDLISLSTAHLVCKIWHEVSSDTQPWETVAYRKGIYVESNSPIQAAVISTFRPYCKAARKIFSINLMSPSFKNPLYEKQSLDAEIAKMDKSRMDPIFSLQEHLKILGPSDDLVEKCHTLIRECIPMIQVWIEAGQLTVDESLFHALSKSSLLVRFDLVFDALIQQAYEFVFALLDQKKNELDFQNCMTTIQRLLETYSTLNHYILYFVKKPSPKIIKNLCYRYLALQCVEVWKNLAMNRFENKEILNPLLKNLTGIEWEKAFEQFMVNEGLDVNVKIHFPAYIQKILQKMDETDFKKLTDGVPTHPIQNANIFVQYMVKQIRKNHLESLISTRTC